MSLYLESGWPHEQPAYAGVEADAAQDEECPVQAVGLWEQKRVTEDEALVTVSLLNCDKVKVDGESVRPRWREEHKDKGEDLGLS